MKLDILAFGSHPDDVEMACSGTLASAIHQGKTVGIVDLTRGEMGTRGSMRLRTQEGKKAGQLLGISVRENLKLKDCFFENNKATQQKVIQIIRHYQPDIVFCNATQDRHPDHGKGACLVRDAFFMAGLSKLPSSFRNKKQKHWRPYHLLHYIQDMDSKADFYVDISNFWEIKKKAILAFNSQFYDAKAPKINKKKTLETYISTPQFWEAFEARYRYYGKKIGCLYAEPFQNVKPIGVKNLDFLIHSPF